MEPKKFREIYDRVHSWRPLTTADTHEELALTEIRRFGGSADDQEEYINWNPDKDAVTLPFDRTPKLTRPSVWTCLSDVLRDPSPIACEILACELDHGQAGKRSPSFGKYSTGSYFLHPCSDALTINVARFYADELEGYMTDNNNDDRETTEVIMGVYLNTESALAVMKWTREFLEQNADPEPYLVVSSMFDVDADRVPDRATYRAQGFRRESGPSRPQSLPFDIRKQQFSQNNTPLSRLEGHYQQCSVKAKKKLPLLFVQLGRLRNINRPKGTEAMPLGTERVQSSRMWQGMRRDKKPVDEQFAVCVNLIDRQLWLVCSEWKSYDTADFDDSTGTCMTGDNPDYWPMGSTTGTLSGESGMAPFTFARIVKPTLFDLFHTDNTGEDMELDSDSFHEEKDIMIVPASFQLDNQVGPCVSRQGDYTFGVVAWEVNLEQVVAQESPAQSAASSDEGPAKKKVKLSSPPKRTARSDSPFEDPYSRME